MERYNGIFLTSGLLFDLRKDEQIWKANYALRDSNLKSKTLKGKMRS